MPRVPPPPVCPGTPVVTALRRGMQVVRIHSAARAAHAMNPTARPVQHEGGRFDALGGDYSYLYVADSAEAAIAETFTRDLPFDGSARLLPRSALDERVLTTLDVTDEVLVVSLVGPDATQVGQDVWLTTCSPADYVLTRRWAAAIRSWTQPTGLAYRCRHDQTRTAWALFEPPGTPVHPALAVASDGLRLDRGYGLTLVRRVLARHNATVSRL